MNLWNVIYRWKDEHLFVAAMNSIRPDSYNARRKLNPYYNDIEVCTMVEMTEEEALVVALTSNIKVEKLE